MSSYWVAEKFVSINGEAVCAGELAAFIRFRKCNLHCSYCDTRWANSDDSPAVSMTAAELSQWVNSEGIHNVTLTGGEPLLQQDIGELISLLSESGHRVEIETNGSQPLDELAAAEYRPVFTMDYKLPGSGMEEHMCTSNFSLLCRDDTVKFVAGSLEDLDKAAEIIEKYELIGRCHIYFSPVFGKIEPADIVGFMEKKRLNGVRLQLQLHKYIWDPDMKGV